MDSQQRKKLVAEEIWLHYFNDYLHDHGVISEREYLRMKLTIDQHCSKKRNVADRAIKDLTNPLCNGVDHR